MIIQAEQIGDKIYTMEETGKDENGLSGIKDRVYNKDDIGYDTAKSFIDNQRQEDS